MHPCMHSLQACLRVRRRVEDRGRRHDVEQGRQKRHPLLLLQPLRAAPRRPPPLCRWLGLGHLVVSIPQCPHCQDGPRELVQRQGGHQKGEVGDEERGGHEGGERGWGRGEGEEAGGPAHEGWVEGEEGVGWEGRVAPGVRDAEEVRRVPPRKGAEIEGQGGGAGELEGALVHCVVVVVVVVG
jgi:hypothetical protein